MAKKTIFSHYLAVLHFRQHHHVQYKILFMIGHVQKCLFLLSRVFLRRNYVAFSKVNTPVMGMG